MPYPKVPRQISNPISENIQKLASLFPSAVKDGELDIEALKQELGDFTEVGPEKYELTWAGKQKAKQTAFEPIIGKTLKYVPEDSKHPDTTENLFIEGDNLEVLKLLRQNYYGAVKMIYIDPPYNTGNDFIYNDNFRMSKEESDIAEGDMSDIGERYTKNRKDHNRYHTHWLNMMYSRLKLARELLKEDGVIFISIDDTEQSNLKKICDEIFGTENFINNLIWKKRDGAPNDRKMGSVHEYILVFGKTKSKTSQKTIAEENFNLMPRTEKADSQYRVFDEPDGPDARGAFRKIDTTATGKGGRYVKSLYYPIENPYTKELVYPRDGSCWRHSKETMEQLQNERRLYWGVKGTAKTPMRKLFLSETKQGMTTPSILPNMPFNQHAAREIEIIFDKKSIYETPKPTDLIKLLVRIGSSKNDLVLDFFSGSCSTAAALFKVNNEDHGRRNFIMVQLPEFCNSDSDAFKSGYKTIADIGKERIRRAGEKILEENKDKEGIENLDIGFKVFRVADTNINWLREDLRGGDLFDHYDKNASDKDRLDFTPGFTDLDVVYEIMLRQTDIPLSSRVEQLTAMGQRTYLFADSFLVCLETSITRELVERLAAIEPLPIKFIFRDSAFDDDIALKDETFRTLSALTDRNSGGEKHTYTVEFI